MVGCSIARTDEEAPLGRPDALDEFFRGRGRRGEGGAEGGREARSVSWGWRRCGKATKEKAEGRTGKRRMAHVECARSHPLQLLSKWTHGTTADPWFVRVAVVCCVLEEEGG